MQHQSQPLFLFSSFNNISSSLTSPSKWKECFNKGRAAQTYFLENLLKQHRITLSLTQNSRHAFLSSFVFLTPISISPLHLHIFTYTEQSHSTFLCTKTSKKSSITATASLCFINYWLYIHSLRTFCLQLAAACSRMIAFTL